MELNPRQIIIDQLGDRRAAALLVNGRLEDLFIEHDAPPPGTIFRATVQRPMKGQGGVFLSAPDGMLYLRTGKGLRQGEQLLVQVTGYAEPGKAIPVTQKLLFKSRYAIVTPEAPGLNLSKSIRDEARRDELLELAHEAMEGAKTGLILRSSAADASDEAVFDDINAMRTLAQQIISDSANGDEKLVEGDDPHMLAWREWSEPAQVIETPNSFDTYGVIEQIESALDPQIAIADGMSLWIEATRALIAVDVNTGRDSSFAAGLKANLACAAELPRALRLRGLAGQITLDLAPMPKKDRRLFETKLRAAFRADKSETVLAGWTPLGHYELQRKRDRLPLEKTWP